MAGPQVEDVDQRRIFVHGVMKMPDRTAAGIRGADERERVAVPVIEHHSVERAAAGVAGADPDRQPGDVGFRLRPPAKCLDKYEETSRGGLAVNGVEC